MKKFLGWILILVLIGAAAWYLQRPSDEPPAPQLPDAEDALQTEPTQEPFIRHPIAPPDTINGAPDSTPQPPLPSLPPLNESDGFVKDRLILSGFGAELDNFLIFKNIIRRVVITIDNLPKKQLPLKYRATQSVAGEFKTQQDAAGSILIDTANFNRYTPFIKFAEDIDTKSLVAFYTSSYPLFQEAYVELGYPTLYFNDRLIHVIDHLLETPEIVGPIKLTRPGVFYKFADPELESRSAGQKILIRIGRVNATKIKAKLRDVRNELVRRNRDE